MHISILADSTEYCGRLTEMIRGFAPDATITEWTDPDLLLRYASQLIPDMLLVVTDTEAAEKSSAMIPAAEQIANLYPQTGIVFISDDDRYAMDALRIHALGYLVKPVDWNQIRSEYEFCIRRRDSLAGTGKRSAKKDRRLKFRVDGGFDCLLDGVPVQFNRTKTRELIEYLAAKNGGMATDKELLDSLWGCENESTKSYLRTVKAELVNLFREADCEDAIVKHRGRIGIMMDRIS